MELTAITLTLFQLSCLAFTRWDKTMWQKYIHSQQATEGMTLGLAPPSGHRRNLFKNSFQLHFPKPVYRIHVRVTVVMAVSLCHSVIFFNHCGYFAHKPCSITIFTFTERHSGIVPPSGSRGNGLVITHLSFFEVEVPIITAYSWISMWFLQ